MSSRGPSKNCSELIPAGDLLKTWPHTLSGGADVPTCGDAFVPHPAKDSPDTNKSTAIPPAAARVNLDLLFGVGFTFTSVATELGHDEMMVYVNAARLSQLRRSVVHVEGADGVCPVIHVVAID